MLVSWRLANKQTGCLALPSLSSSFIIIRKPSSINVKTGKENVFESSVSGGFGCGSKISNNIFKLGKGWIYGEKRGDTEKVET